MLISGLYNIINANLVTESKNNKPHFLFKIRGTMDTNKNYGEFDKKIPFMAKLGTYSKKQKDYYKEKILITSNKCYIEGNLVSINNISFIEIHTIKKVGYDYDQKKANQGQNYNQTTKGLNFEEEGPLMENSRKKPHEIYKDNSNNGEASKEGVIENEIDFNNINN